MHAMNAHIREKRSWATAAIVAVTIALACAFLSAPNPASASEPSAGEGTRVEVPDSQAPQFTPEDVQQAIDELKGAGVPHDIVEGKDGDTIVFHFDEGDFGLPIPEASDDANSIESRLAFGNNSKGTFLSLNATDQQALITGGTGALIAAVIAISPLSGKIAQIVLNFGIAYLTDFGACPGNQEMWIYFKEGTTGPNYTGIDCMPVSAPGGG